jgi:hypothetical protein
MIIWESDTQEKGFNGSACGARQKARPIDQLTNNESCKSPPAPNRDVSILSGAGTPVRASAPKTLTDFPALNLDAMYRAVCSPTRRLCRSRSNS